MAKSIFLITKKKKVIYIIHSKQWLDITKLLNAGTKIFFTFLANNCCSCQSCGIYSLRTCNFFTGDVFTFNILTRVLPSHCVWFWYKDQFWCSFLGYFNQFYLSKLTILESSLIHKKLGWSSRIIKVRKVSVSTFC